MTKTETDLKELVMMIAQADTGQVLYGHENQRVQMVVQAARRITLRYPEFFDYWEDR